ncbi:MAG: thiamine biosynthesis protein [Candidatus Electrothrix sp. GW3-4]|uniref:thiamine biosynthesis protein n=1 Tax=Candidatus Electrothrix sp. GW3-4 TaxID=3126740 RepID=UPI0030D3ABEC
MQDVTAIGLFSGGLDSILACRVIAEQGIRVWALKFVTPFFDHDLLDREEAYQQEVKEKYGLDVELVDLSAGYIELLRNPSHGFGKNFNPCIDCKIMMLRKAKELMKKYGASFLITGEVLGQRPMSQRRDTLNLIERDAECRDILIRPLSAQLMNPSLPEQQGLVDRERLYTFSGRGRKPQIALARELGITDFPAPAGGCVLTDPNLAARIRRFYEGLFLIGKEEITTSDIQLLLLGRQFRLPGGHWLVLGRNEQENDRLQELCEQDDWLLYMPERPGPAALLRRGCTLISHSEEREKILGAVTGLVIRYGRKIQGKFPPGEVFFQEGEVQHMLQAKVLADEVFQEWIV